MLVLGLPAAGAHAAPLQQSILMDDSEIVYQTPENVDTTFAQLKALGVDTVRVSVYWRLVAPAADTTTKPAFDAADPAAYPAENWTRYDNIVTLAQKHGLRPFFSLTSPAPLWATGPAPREDIKKTFDPSAAEFQAFTTAVGKRYAGDYRLPSTQPTAPPKPLIGEAPPPPAPVPGNILPRVDMWSFWNEPNHPGWLTPSWLPDPRSSHRPLVMAAARIYRGLADAGWAGLAATGHSSDTVLMGETAPRGLEQRALTRPIKPLDFIREVYCLDRSFKPFNGGEAQVRGCPVDRAGQSRFSTEHPGLFENAGWAHHPYALESPPLRPDRVKDNVTIADLPRITKTLDRAYGRYGKAKKPPIYLTEYGYQTNPPDPTIGVSYSRQADYLAQAEHVAFRNGRIASTAQFLLKDDGPLTEFPVRDPRYWGTFQSGLLNNQGAKKSAFEDYQRTVDVQPRRPKRGSKLRIWGVLRSAANGSALGVKVQFSRTGKSGWRTVGRPATVTNPRGNFNMSVKFTRNGSYRLVWTDPAAGAPVVTRAVAVKRAAPKKKRSTRRKAPARR